MFETKGIVQYVLSDHEIPNFVENAMDKFNLKFYNLEDSKSKFLQIFQEVREGVKDELITAMMCAVMRHIRLQLPDTYENRRALVETITAVVPTKSTTVFTHACQIESLLNKMDKRYNNKCIIQTCTCVILSLVVFTGTTLVLYNIY